MSKTAEEIVDAALGIDAAQIERCNRLCEEAYPSRSPKIAAQIRAHARLLLSPESSDEINTAMIKTIEMTKGADFVRATPSKEDALRYAEAEYKRLFGKDMDGMQRLTKSREIATLDADALSAYVPGAFKLDAAKKEIPVAAPMNQTDQLDQLVLERFGKTKHEISAMDRRRYHDALRPELDKTDKRSLQIVENATAQESAGRPLDPAAKIAAFRAAQNLKAG